jgi:hypothetical protein
MEIKLQSHSTINGIIMRNSGKQISTEPKTRIQNITAKTILKHNSEALLLKRTGTKILDMDTLAPVNATT